MFLIFWLHYSSTLATVVILLSLSAASLYLLTSADPLLSFCDIYTFYFRQLCYVLLSLLNVCVSFYLDQTKYSAVTDLRTDCGGDTVI